MDTVRTTHADERIAPNKPGIPMLLLSIFLMIATTVGIIALAYFEDSVNRAVFVTGMILISIFGYGVSIIILPGLKVIRPNEGVVLTLFGKYHGTLKKEGYYFVNPFCAAVAPPPGGAVSKLAGAMNMSGSNDEVNVSLTPKSMKYSNKISLKTMTLNNDKQKINDKLGNPIIIGIVVVWRVQNTVKALFNVDDYVDYLSNQCDAALRNTVRLYPYDSTDDATGDETSLRGSSQEIAEKLRTQIQEKVEHAGLEVMEAHITNLAYAPEIAAAMLQRQQASAIVDARQLIVDGAVGMVEMALSKLDENHVVALDDERKAAMVSNLLVVLCGNRDAQPIVNSGSLY